MTRLLFVSFVLAAGLIAFGERGAAASSGVITAGTRPPLDGSGFGLFAIGELTFAQLEIGVCGAATADRYWVTDEAGNFVVYVPGAGLAAVNQRWNAMFPGGRIPGLMAILGKCA